MSEKETFTNAWAWPEGFEVKTYPENPIPEPAAVFGEWDGHVIIGKKWYWWNTETGKLEVLDCPPKRC